MKMPIIQKPSFYKGKKLHNRMTSCYQIVILILFFDGSLLGESLSVLFLGNSYTYSNSLATMIASLAESGGDTLTFDMNAPGGYTLYQHTENPTSLSKMTSGSWDYVILQEQSQFPTIPYYRNNSTYPAARELDSLIHAHGSETVFFMTWGRRYGGIQCIDTFCSADFADFSDMQDTLAAAYRHISDELGAILSPVGLAWANVLDIDSTYVFWIGDNSHPNNYGSYLAACVFYSILFCKSPAGYTYYGSLSVAEASFLQQVGYETAAEYMNIKHLDELPQRFGFQCYPNPFNSAVKITAPESAEIEIFDVNGRRVADAPFDSDQETKFRSLSEVETTANGEFVWTPDASISSGIYIVRAQVGEQEIMKRVVYLK